MPEPTLADSLPNPESTFYKHGLTPSNRIVARAIGLTALSVDLSAFVGRWVELKAEGAAGERLGYFTWRTDAVVGSVGENAAPVIAAVTGATQCATIDVGERVRRFVVPGFTVLRVVSSVASVTLRVEQAEI